MNWIWGTNHMGRNPRIAFLDTNVLYGGLDNDMFLTLAEPPETVYQPKWSDYVMGELETHLKERAGEEDGVHVKRRLHSMARAFPKANVDDTLIPGVITASYMPDIVISERDNGELSSLLFLAESLGNKPCHFPLRGDVTHFLPQPVPPLDILLIGKHDGNHTFPTTRNMCVILRIRPETAPAYILVPLGPIEAVLACIRFQSIRGCGKKHEPFRIIHTTRIICDFIRNPMVDLEILRIHTFKINEINRPMFGD